MRRFVLFLLFSASVFGAQIILPGNAFERDSPIHAIFRTASLATGKGQLKIDWTDSYGRLVQSSTIPVVLDDENEIGFVLDLRRAVAMENEVHAHFSFEGTNKKNVKDVRNEDATVSFVAKPPAHSWWDYNIIMWQHYSPADFAVLKTLGINGSQNVSREPGPPPQFVLQNNLRWYAENIATDFYSTYHHYYPDRQNGWEFDQAKALYQKDPTSKEAFKRHPSLSDEKWLAKIHTRLTEAAKRLAPYRPFFYSLGDETGIAQLASFWDFDFSDESLEAMRDWLKQRYGTLAALNAQWGTHFTKWDLVTPMTTNEAMKSTDGNWSSWGDFKEWMDVAWASALKMGNDAVRAVDPEALVGIGGGQMPGWGGYDYSRIAKALTAIEPYDIGNNIEILRSLNPNMAVMTTGFQYGPWEKNRVWYEFLHGNRGLVLWDDKHEFIGADGKIGARGRESAVYYNELRSGLGALLINSRRQSDPIAIHYSQPSMRTEWMLERRRKGDEWSKRYSWHEYRDSEFLRLRESYCKLLEDNGLQFNFVSYGQVEEGELLRGGYRVLILPHSSSLSAAESKAIHEFVAQGGTIVADSDPGQFDEHGRRLAQSQLADLFTAANPRAIRLTGNVLDYHQDRVLEKGGEVRTALAAMMQKAGVHPEFTVVDEKGQTASGVETIVYRNGSVRIVGLIVNPELRIDELGPPEFKSNERFARARTLKLNLPAPMYVYDLRKGQSLGRASSVPVNLDPYEPAMYAIGAEELPHMTVAAPEQLMRGETATIGISLPATAASVHAIHIDIVDGSGKALEPYSGNLLAQNGHAVWSVPIALNDPAGTWTVRVRDVLSGQVQTVRIHVS